MKDLLSKKRAEENLWPSSVKNMDIQGIITTDGASNVQPFHLDHIAEDGIDLWVQNMHDTGERAKVKFTKPHMLEIDGTVLWCVPLEGGGYKLRLEVKDVSKLLG